MLVVLSDDFSGAAEIAGIAYRYGLTAEVQLKFDATSKVDLVVLDTDTRGLTETKAVKKIKDIAIKLKSGGVRIVFKKIDSVLRGHLIPEINTLQQTFQFNRVMVMPANPAKKRKIIAGNYFVNGISLDQTVFASDPQFPTTTSSIEKILRKEQSLLPYIHLKPGDKLPSSFLITGDVASKEDLKKYAGATGDNDLCCGAAEFFEAFLQHKGYSANALASFIEWPTYSIIISGSTVREQFETGTNIFSLSLPGEWRGNEFILEKQKEEEWQGEVLTILKDHHIPFISIMHEIKQVQDSSEIFSGYFVRLVKKLSEELGNIHFAITGGATASAIIRNTIDHGLKVKKEIAPGIVSLIDEQTNVLYTVKPGSYLWPDVFIQSITDQTKQH